MVTLTLLSLLRQTDDNHVPGGPRGDDALSPWAAGSLYDGNPIVEMSYIPYVTSAANARIKTSVVF